VIGVYVLKKAFPAMNHILYTPDCVRGPTWTESLKRHKARKDGLYGAEQIKSLFGTNQIPKAERIKSY
jgi:hypothetical protein